MAKSLLVLTLLSFSLLFVNAKVSLPENQQESAGKPTAQTSVHLQDSKLLLPSEEQPWESHNLRAPLPTEPTNLFSRNRRFHRLYIRRPYLLGFPHRFRHHHIEVTTDAHGGHSPEKRTEFEGGDFQRPSWGFENRSPEEGLLPVGHAWFDEDLDHHQNLKIEKWNRKLSKDHGDDSYDQKHHGEGGGGFFNWINSILH